MVGTLAIEERRQNERELLALYRDKLVAIVAKGMVELDEIWEQNRRWIIYGMRACVPALACWRHTSRPFQEYFFAATEDHDIWQLLVGKC